MEVRRAQSSLGDWGRATDPALFSALKELGRVTQAGTSRLGVWWPVLVGAFIALALTGPAKQRADGAAFRNLDGVVFVVDASAEMVAGGSFEEAMLAARLVAQAAGSRQSALIVYAQQPYEGAGFTTDARAIGDVLTYIDAETIGEEGARPDLALAMAGEMIAAADIKFADIVLVTAGAGVSEAAYGEARRLTEGAVQLSVLHPGNPDAEALAALGSGISASFTRPEPLVDALVSALPERLAEAGFSVVLWRDYGRYLLILALLPAFLLFRREA